MLCSTPGCRGSCYWVSIHAGDDHKCAGCMKGNPVALSAAELEALSKQMQDMTKALDEYPEDKQPPDDFIDALEDIRIQANRLINVAEAILEDV